MGNFKTQRNWDTTLCTTGDLWRDFAGRYMRNLAKAWAAAETGPLEDRKPERKATEIKRVWAHGAQGQGDKCYRASRPVHTDVNKVPGECRSCDNDEWHSKGKVERIKESKQVIRSMP